MERNVPSMWNTHPHSIRQKGKKMRPNFLDPKLVTKRVATVAVAVVTAYTMGALMTAGMALGGWEYVKQKRTKDMRKTWKSHDIRGNNA